MNPDYVWKYSEIHEKIAYRLTANEFAELWVTFTDTMDNYGYDLLADLLAEYGAGGSALADSCPNCGEDLPRENEPGWPCDACTEAQPLGVWVSSWGVEG